MKRPDTAVTVLSLVALAVVLLVIGVVSGTVLRHAIQAVPAWIAAAGIVLGKDWARRGASAVFHVWGMILLAIWLTLTGTLQIVPGRFSGTEVILSLIAGALCVTGGYTVARRDRSVLAAKSQSGVYVGFVLLQIVAIVLSMTQLLAYD
ncbi:MAG: hypothetical protein ACE5JI_04495 [Acidobacteriota bacterium]